MERKTMVRMKAQKQAWRKGERESLLDALGN